MISRRARAWLHHDPFLVNAHFACLNDIYDPKYNPHGYVNFGTAENLTCFDLIQTLLKDSTSIRARDTHYQELHGSTVFRAALARFLGRRAGRTLDPDGVIIASGASAILELLSFILCDEGDHILVPAPYYAGFDHDCALRSMAHIMPIACRAPDFAISAGDFEDAYAQAIDSKRNVRALLINTPHNPLGYLYDEKLLKDIISFAAHHDLEVILDEIYAESLQPGIEHFSGLRFPDERIHVVYGFAKDFGLSGYKVGVLYTENAAVRRAAQAFAYFHSVSMLTQRTLAHLLSDDRLPEFFTRMRARLKTSYDHAAGELRGCSIPHLPVRGGIVLWLDLRSMLRDPTHEEEMRVCKELFHARKLSISPGQAFSCAEPGWFRMCYTVPEAALIEGVRRLGRYKEQGVVS